MKSATDQKEMNKVAAREETTSYAITATVKKQSSLTLETKDEIIAMYDGQICDQKDFEDKYRTYERAIERALKTREKSDQDALTAYKKITEKAAKDYRDAMEWALRDCRYATNEARQELLKALKSEAGPLPQYQHNTSSGFVHAVKHAGQAIARWCMSLKNIFRRNKRVW
jgi:ABC-type glutathione transport system ATPase component